MSTEHTIATDDEAFPEGAPNPLDAWYKDLEELPEVGEGEEDEESV